MRTEHRSTWEDAYRAEAPRLWRSLLLFSGSREIASDAMAEAFAQGIARGDAVRTPGAWVWRAAFALARGELASAPDDELVDHIVDDGSAYELLDVMAALRRLSPMQRASVVLHHYMGYPAHEIAVILGTSRSAVGVHLFRGRARLRRELGGDDDV